MPLLPHRRRALPLAVLVVLAALAAPLFLGGCDSLAGSKETVVDPATSTNPKGEPGQRAPAAPGAPGTPARDEGRM
jgi:hypothetical protein